MSGGELLQDAMGMIDHTYISAVMEDVPAHRASRTRITRYASLAACLCLLIGSVAGMALHHRIKQGVKSLPPTEILPSMDMSQIVWDESSLSAGGLATESEIMADSMATAKWSGWNMSGDLYLALQSAAPDTYFAVLVTRKYNYTDKMNFVYQGKTRGQWEVELEIRKTQQRKLEELSKEGEWLKYGTDLYTKGTLDGEKWTKEMYEERIHYYGAYFLEQYIVNGTLLSQKIEQEIIKNGAYLTEIATLLLDLDTAYIAQCAEEDLLKFTEKGIHYALKKGRLYLFVTAEELSGLRVLEKSKLFLSLANRRTFASEDSLPSAQIDENVIGFAFEKITFYTDGVRYNTVSSDQEVIEATRYLMERWEYTSDFLYISVYANPRLDEKALAAIGYQSAYFSTYSDLILLNVPLSAVNLTAIRDLSLLPQVSEIHISPPMIAVLT